MAQVNQRIDVHFDQATKGAKQSIDYARITVREQTATIASISAAIDSKKNFNNRFNSLLQQFKEEN